MRLPTLERAGSSQPPVYRQIADHIRDEIERGDLAEGDRLPPIRELARSLEVNRDTVSLAYESLATEGWLESAVGRGTFVRSLPRRDDRRDRAPTSFAPSLSEPAERLLEIESARPRYGTGADLVPLHSLIPDPAHYPVDAFRRCLNRAIAEGGPEIFLYGSPQGHLGLRRAIAARFATAGIDAAADDLVLCHGASQGIALAVRLFAGPGDAVAVEEPTYHNVLATLAGQGVDAVPVPMSDAGPDLDALEGTLRRPEVKAFYTIPSFHNPLGTTTSVEHRRRLVELCERCAVPVLEDSFEMDLRYKGRPVPPLAAFDRTGLVVHLFSFSKSLFPGLRVGSILARGRAIEALLALKHATDLSDSLPLQAALADFVQTGGYDRHLARIRRVLESRRDALLAALARHMPSGTRWTEPEGGYQVWVELPFDVDTRDLLADAARAGVLFAPGSIFLPDRRPSRAMRLTVAQCDEAAIDRGVRALGQVVVERIENSPVAGFDRVHL
ncbi:MAG: PLP-dependent aminotransferase family protein [Myxococcota bacterium]